MAGGLRGWTLSRTLCCRERSPRPVWPDAATLPRIGYQIHRRFGADLEICIRVPAGTLTGTADNESVAIMHVPGGARIRWNDRL